MRPDHHLPLLQEKTLTLNIAGVLHDLYKSRREFTTDQVMSEPIPVDVNSIYHNGATKPPLVK
jgi:hypothetical protein